MTHHRGNFLSTHIRTIAALFFGLVFSAFVAYATPPGSPYTAGETLDPTCAPGDTNCTVDSNSSQWTTTGSDIYYNTGNVGIGTTTPGSILSIYLNNSDYTNTNGSGSHVLLTNPSVTGQNVISSVINGTVVAKWRTDYVGNISWVAGATGSHDFYTGGDFGVGQSRMSIKNNGNVGIGTTTPAEKLSVDGNIQVGAAGLIKSLSSSLNLVPANGRVIAYDGSSNYSFDLYSFNTIGISLNSSGISYLNGGNVGIGAISPGELLSLGTSGSVKGVLSLSGDTSGKITVQPATAAGTWTLTLPTSAGTNGYFLKTNGSGVTSWATPSSLTGSTSTLGTETWLGTSVAGLGTTSSDATVFIGIESGYNAASADQSNFIGYQAGYNAASSYTSNFIGYQAGNGATAYASNFIGYQAGLSVSGTNNAIFIGTSAGSGASNSAGSTFIGSSAGASAQSNNSNFIGNSAGSSTTSANSSVFIGSSTGSGALAAANSVFLGEAAGMNAATAANSIFIGTYAGGGVFSGDAVDNTGNADDFSILIGNNTTTDGNKNSIALGSYATNTAANQFMIGSTTRPIDQTKIIGSASTQCTITTGTGIACTSDERLKTNIVDLETNTLEKLRDVRTVTFNWRDNPTSNNQIGFIAQNLEPLFPELVATDSTGYKSVYYAQMTPILVEAVKELDLKVESMTSLIDGTAEAPSFADNLRAWFANAGNHITRIFTGEVCLTDPDGSSECLNKQELGQLKQLLHPVVESGGGEDVPPPDDTGDTPPEETLPEETSPTPPEDTPLPSDIPPETVDQ